MMTVRSFRPLLATALAASLALAAGAAAFAGGSDDMTHPMAEATSGQPGHAGHDHAAHDHRMPPGMAMDETAHAAALEGYGQGQYIRTESAYPVPDASLRDQTGRRVSFAEAIDHDGPLLLNFIFTSCSTICPVMSATFGQAQDEIAAIDPDYRMVSVSIDPEYDTPSRLREYAGLHDARENWTFLTGDAGEIRKVIAAFDAIYRGDNKMYHLPYTYLRPATDAPWIRIEGLLSAGDLIEEYRAMLARPTPKAS